ncbi:MAG: YeeE/YedE family protein [Panacagrimonas sp.]
MDVDIVVNVDSWTRAAIGGGMIGLAAALMIIFNGRIAGVSGVLGGLVLDRKTSETPWRALFLGGLMLGALLVMLVRPDLAGAALKTGWIGILAAGLIVGFGTRMGSGCTSGHGVCGIGRLSQRSIVATCTFTAAGFVTVFVLRHLLGGL